LEPAGRQPFLISRFIKPAPSFLIISFRSPTLIGWNNSYRRIDLYTAFQKKPFWPVPTGNEVYLTYGKN
jgi:hypothetical protein